MIARNIITYMGSAWRHAGVRRYFANTGWMFTEKALRMISGILVGALVARYLQPDGYGLLNYALSLVALFTVFATLGLEAIVIRHLVRNERDRDAIMGTSFSLRFSAAVLICLILIAVMAMSDTSEETKQLIYIISVGAIFESFAIIDFFFQSRVEARYTVISQIVALVGISLFRIFLILINAPLIWFAWTTVIDALLIAIGLLLFYLRDGRTIMSWRFDKILAKSLLRDSWPFVFQSLAITVYMKIDQLMVKWMLGNAATGNYGVAVRLSEMWNFLPMAICASVLPALLHARERDRAIYERRLQLLYDTMVVFSVCIAIVMTVIGSWIVTLLFGDAYSDSGSLLTMYIWSSVFIFLGIANGKWIISENLQVLRMKSLIVAAILNVLLNLVLIPTVGLKGAALSTLLSYSFAYYFSLALSRKTWPAFISSSKALNVVGAIRRLIKMKGAWSKL